MSFDEKHAATLQELNQLKHLCKKFLNILELEEESSNGKKFHPTKLTSCRAFDVAVANNLLRQIKKITKEN